MSTKIKKAIVVTIVGIAVWNKAFPQGTIYFNNRISNGTNLLTFAPIYGLNPESPMLRQQGNAATNINPGFNDYTGHPLLLGTGFTAALYGGPGPDDLSLLTTTTFRTGANFGGTLTPVVVSVPNAVPGQTATFLVRVWDNRSGLLTIWASAVQDPSVAKGESLPFTVGPLGGDLIHGTPAQMTNLISFNISQQPIYYSLALRTIAEGEIVSEPFLTSYPSNAHVKLTAVPRTGSTFVGWSGDAVSITNPLLIRVTSNKTITANFLPVGMPAIFVDGDFIPSGTRAVEGSAQIKIQTTFPDGLIFYTLDGKPPSFLSSLYSGPFTVQHSATIRAKAWDADFQTSSEADPVSVVILPTYQLQMTTAGGGSLEFSPAAETYLSNTTVTVSATPTPGWVFLQWLGDASGTNPAISITMTRDKCVSAVFGTTLTTAASDGGTVLLQPSATLYPYGTLARLTALPQSGNSFVLWGNAGSGTNNPLLYSVTGPNRTVSAAFAPLNVGQSALAVALDGFGSVTASPRGNRFNNGQVVTLTAQPDAGQWFLGWMGDVGGTNNPLVITMNASKVITANFTKRPRLDVVRCPGVGTAEEFHFLLTGGFGEAHVIDATTNLTPGTAWTPVATLTNFFGTVQFNDPFLTNRINRFYRARQ